MKNDEVNVKLKMDLLIIMIAHKIKSLVSEVKEIGLRITLIASIKNCSIRLIKIFYSLNMNMKGSLSNN
jgi:hypothetical protein